MLDACVAVHDHIDIVEERRASFRHHNHQECQRQSREAVERLCQTRNLQLTPRRRQVLDTLLASHQPLGAYDILGELNRIDPEARIAPPIVYRALDFLSAEGMVHRIESLNAYIACSQPGHHCVTQFLICRECEQVAELETTNQTLLADAERYDFEVDYSVVEIMGICAECRQHA